MMADHSTLPPGKKLYIETLGCQMNVLDSALVVERPAQRGLRAYRRYQQGRYDPL